MQKPVLAATTLLLSFSAIIAAPNPMAKAATRIQFPSGSYCGSYSGDFSGGREFVLGLGRGQTLTSRNTGGGTQYAIYVSGPTGNLSGQRASEGQINYYIPASGDYYIYVESSIDYSAIEFCAF
ncbi:hypothetical protein IQ241_14540 [Romeria aff. gracilis LEGE 07310]|uniref:Uncharacterized protein n=1 Tax=Vasconcelosia minhoensis LEGE 07310 TaxID=915328 RepID=A0A8J7DNR6_9CYAN|nr:hypothetical protein [Romeria gracilis]MBE9078500.1 hypothetical protein [Romeria aff. gracilis LEGE 07310]